MLAHEFPNISPLPWRETEEYGEHGWFVCDPKGRIVFEANSEHDRKAILRVFGTYDEREALLREAAEMCRWINVGCWEKVNADRLLAKIEAALGGSEKEE